ncbi:hypothetical protein ABKV19_027427, partial [Rosa sericea]
MLDWSRFPAKGQRVAVDNGSGRKATLIKVDSAIRVEVCYKWFRFGNLSIIIRRASISADGDWFMD